MWGVVPGFVCADVLRQTQVLSAWRITGRDLGAVALLLRFISRGDASTDSAVQCVSACPERRSCTAKLQNWEGSAAVTGLN